MASTKLHADSDSRKRLLAAQRNRRYKDKVRPPLTQERLKELLNYDPLTGIFTWKVRQGGTANPGEPAGSLQPHGYIRLTVEGVQYYAHRLAWFYMTGRWPVDEIDHANGNRAENFFANLREADRFQNLGNTKRRSDNTSGHKGVTWNKECRKWAAQIGIRGEYRSLGLFPTFEEARDAYRLAALAEWGEFARLE